MTLSREGLHTVWFRGAHKTTTLTAFRIYICFWIARVKINIKANFVFTEIRWKYLKSADGAPLPIKTLFAMDVFQSKRRYLISGIRSGARFSRLPIITGPGFVLLIWKYDFGPLKGAFTRRSFWARHSKILARGPLVLGTVRLIY